MGTLQENEACAEDAVDKDEEFDEDADADFFLELAAAAGMRTVEHRVMKMLACVISDEDNETEAELCAGMAVVLLNEGVEDAVKEAALFAHHLVSL